MTARAEAVASVDVGTTAVKGVVLARSGALLAEHEVALHTDRPGGGRVEQDADHWWDALRQVCAHWAQAGADLAALRALVLSGQMQDVVLTRDAAPRHPALLYADERAAEEAALAEATLGEDIARATGNPYGAASVLPKLLWLQRHAPAALGGGPRLHVGAKDVLIERLTGAHVTDHTTAATTGLYDLRAGRWHARWLDALQLPVALPTLRWPGEVAGHVHAAAARLLGLPAGLPVLTGLGDAGATTLGAGVARLGERHAYLGTSGWLGAVTAPEQQPGRADRFRLPLLTRREVLAVAPLTNAGSAHRWAAQTFADGDFARLEALLTHAPPARVLCLPYLAGERSPVHDPHARGVFLGVDPTTTPADLARSVLEGVAYALRSTADGLGAAPGARPMTLLGGGTRSAVWCQVMADVFHCEVRVPERADLLPVLGGASPAFQHLGWASPEAFEARVLRAQGSARYAPSTLHAPLHDAQFARFQRLYPAVQALF